MASRAKAPTAGKHSPPHLDTQATRLKVLHEHHPKASSATLGKLYAAAFGSTLSLDQVKAALRRAGIFRRTDHRQEVRERPRRIAKLCSSVSRLTKDRLIAAYQERYGVLLSLDSLYVTLHDLGIQLNEPRRKREWDEIELRPLRLADLAEEFPDATYDHLGKKYDEEYGTRLGPTLVGSALNRLGIYRHRVVDTDELAERPRRLRVLCECYPEFAVAELTARYNSLYETSLSEVTVRQTLVSIGLQRPAASSSELEERTNRLRTLQSAYPHLDAAALAKKYRQHHRRKIEVPVLKRTLNKLGIYLPDQRRTRDAEELRERPRRLQELATQFPRLSYTKLGAEYHARYGIKLHRTNVRTTLIAHNATIARQHNHEKQAPLAERRARLLALHQENPQQNATQLSEEYQRRFGSTVRPARIRQDLRHFGIIGARPVDKPEVRARPERLKALRQQYPEWTYRQLADEYEKRYGVWLEHALMSHALALVGMTARPRRR